MIVRRKLILVGGLAAGAGVLLAAPAFAQETTEILAEDVQANLDNVFVLVVGRARHLHAGRVRARRGRAHAGQERGQHHDEEPDGLLRRGHRVLRRRLRHRLRRRATTSSAPTGWFLGDGAFQYGTLTVPVTFLFQVAFAATAATIVSGAMAERTKFKSYFVYSIVISALIYPVVVHWNWGGGWLAQLDARRSTTSPARPWCT